MKQKRTFKATGMADIGSSLYLFSVQVKHLRKQQVWKRPLSSTKVKFQKLMSSHGPVMTKYFAEMSPQQNTGTPISEVLEEAGCGETSHG